MMSAMPVVNPTVTGYGTNRMMSPSRASAINTKDPPAMRVATASPSYPNSATTLATSTTKAPVGPPICTRLPPMSEIRAPATMAV
jgi:hypothetical protein